MLLVLLEEGRERGQEGWQVRLVGPTRMLAVERRANGEGVLRHVHQQGSVLGWVAWAENAAGRGKHYFVMQAGWNVVKCTYSAYFLFVEGDFCFSGHLCCRCCLPEDRRLSIGDAFFVCICCLIVET